MNGLKIKRTSSMILLGLICVLLWSTAAYAADTINLIVPTGAVPGGNVEVSGTMVGAEAGTIMGITVKNPSGNGVFVDETVLNANQEFSFDFRLPDQGEEGNWQVQVSGGGATANKIFSVGAAPGVVTSAPSSTNPGKTVNIQGKVPQGNVPVGITVYDPQGRMIFIDETLSEHNGNYGFQFKLSADAPLGTWTAEIAGGGTYGKSTFNVQSESSPGGGDSSGGGDEETSSSDIPSAVGSLEISAPIGGRVTSSDGKIMVTIPSGAISTDTVLTVEEVTDTANIPTGSFMMDGKIYDISLGTGSIKTGHSVKLTFETTLQDVNEQQINVYYWYGSQWVCLGGQLVGSKVEIEVSHFTNFVVMADPTLPILKDIKSHWAYKEIKRLVGMKVANGYPDNTYQPEKKVTRAEFAKFMVQALDLPVQQTTLSYLDADQIPTWAKGYVAAAEEKGLVQGYNDKTFRPNQLISRAEMSAMIVRALKGQNALASNGQLGFADTEDIPSWAKEYVSLAVQENIINGKLGNKFAPQEKATRAESAVMIYRLLNSLGI